jgi:hypothetical protein
MKRIYAVQVWLPDTEATLRTIHLDPADSDRDYAYAKAVWKAQREVRDWNASQQFPGQRVTIRDLAR